MTTIFLFAGLESQVCYVLAMNICFLIRLRLIFFLSCFVLTNPKIQKKMSVCLWLHSLGYCCNWPKLMIFYIYPGLLIFMTQFFFSIFRFLLLAIQFLDQILWLIVAPIVHIFHNSSLPLVLCMNFNLVWTSIFKVGEPLKMKT